MASKDIGVFYIGVGSELDVDEGNWNTENQLSLLGNTYGSMGSPLAQNIETLTLEDANSDGFLREDDYWQPAEEITYNGVSAILDASLSYTVTVTYTDGTTDTAVVHLLQDVDGRMFLTPEIEADTANNAILGAKPIATITLDGLHNDGHAGQSMTLANNVFICFGMYTRLSTTNGAMCAHKINVGDHLLTLDHGPKEVIWSARRTVLASGKGAPIRVARGALGNGVPETDLFVSQQHRLMLRSRIVQRMFGTPEILVAAKKLLGLPGITLAERPGLITYVHFLLAGHEILFAEGLAAESLLLGSQTDRALRRNATGASMPSCQSSNTTARPTVENRRVVTTLVQRHLRNNKPLYCREIRGGADPAPRWRARAIRSVKLGQNQSSHMSKAL